MKARTQVNPARVPRLVDRRADIGYTLLIANVLLPPILAFAGLIVIARSSTWRGFDKLVATVIVSASLPIAVAALPTLGHAAFLAVVFPMISGVIAAAYLEIARLLRTADSQVTLPDAD
jgi:hypothetical protein